MTQSGGFFSWLAAVAALVVAGVAVPYGLLAGSEGWAVAVFWLAFGLAVVAVIAAGMRHWRDGQ